MHTGSTGRRTRRSPTVGRRHDSPYRGAADRERCSDPADDVRGVRPTAQPPTLPTVDTSAGRRLLRWSRIALGTVPVGIVLLIVWSTVVKTSPSVADDERVRGWRTVARELPATTLLFAILAGGLVFVVLAGRAGRAAEAQRALLWHGAALFLVLLIVVNGSAENIMTTRATTMKWALFPAQAGITALVVLICRRLIRGGAASSPVASAA